MDSQIYGVSNILLVLFFVYLAPAFATLPQNQSSKPSSPAQINSNSILVALLDSHYTELAELVEKALLLHTLEEAVGQHNLTIFAPQNEALERDLDPEFKRFLLQPGNLKSLQTLLTFHVIPERVDSADWKKHHGHHVTLSNHQLHLSGKNSVELATVIRPNDVVRPDGVIHGIERLLIPRSVQEDFNNRRNLQSISAVKPEGAPEVDPRTNRLKKAGSSGFRRFAAGSACFRRDGSRTISGSGAGSRSRRAASPLRRREPGQGLYTDATTLRRIQ